MPMTLSGRELIAKYVELDPYLPSPSEARLKKYGVSVWALVGHFQAIGHDVDAVAEDYQLPREAVEAALAYYEEHRVAIDARLAENTSYMV